MSDESSGSALEPVFTRGNAFWQGEERFLIKGISYLPCRPDSRQRDLASRIDALAEQNLDALRRDIAIFKELGLNTIQISALDPSNNHDGAMRLLAEAGIYVLIRLCENTPVPQPGTQAFANHDSNSGTSTYYTQDFLENALKIVDKFADYPNTLGFMVSADAINNPGVSKLAEISRAAIRDIKAYLHLRPGRKPPVGVTMSEIVSIRLVMLQYFTAGPNEERADFFAPQCWSWARKSSFQISGWKNMVQLFWRFPVPMFLAEFGAYVGQPRLWEEISCLYSPDMTGVFSGGCMYTYVENGTRYGIVGIDGMGEVEKAVEFKRLKMRFEEVNKRAKEELYVDEVQDYESWVGDFPEVNGDWPRWLATADIPRCPLSLEGLREQLTDGEEWQFVEREGDGNVEGLEDRMAHLQV